MHLCSKFDDCNMKCFVPASGLLWSMIVGIETVLCTTYSPLLFMIDLNEILGINKKRISLNLTITSNQSNRAASVSVYGMAEIKNDKTSISMYCKTIW